MKMNLVCSGLDEQTAGEEAYSNILPECLFSASPMDTTTKERSSA